MLLRVRAGTSFRRAPLPRQTVLRAARGDHVMLFASHAAPLHSCERLVDELTVHPFIDDEDEVEIVTFAIASDAAEHLDTKNLHPKVVLEGIRSDNCIFHCDARKIFGVDARSKSEA